MNLDPQQRRHKISPAVTFCFNFSLYKYVQGKSGLPESAPNRQVFKIKMDESEYRTQGTNVSLN